jgi:hypothetical protein
LTSRCASGTRCEPYGRFWACRPIAAEGESCAQGIDLPRPPCVLGTFCDGAVCVREPVVGEACLVTDPPSEFCLGGKCDEAQVCRARAGAGEACAETLDCEGGLRCVAGTCSQWCT